MKDDTVYVYKCAICLGKYDKDGIVVPNRSKVTDYDRKCKPCVKTFGGPHGILVLGDESWVHTLFVM